MIEEKILSYSVEQIADYIGNEAGCVNPDYFLCKKEGGLRLQQVPEEYAQLLNWFREQKFDKYLELGIGDGGSFLLNTKFQPKLSLAVAVDNCAYWGEEQKKRVEEKLLSITHCMVGFQNMATDSFFVNYKVKFNCIFIDADHSYESVLKDFENSKLLLEEGGYIIFHDINSELCPGVRKIWSDNKNKDCIEFIASTTCGIGIWTKEKGA